MAITPVAAAAVQGATVASATPTIWHLLGYPFEAASMCAAIFACGTARWWLGAGALARKQFRLQLDAPVTSMTLAAAAAAVIAMRPEPLTALLLGAGAGMIGEGLFNIAEHRLRPLLGPAGDKDERP